MILLKTYPHSLSYNQPQVPAGTRGLGTKYDPVRGPTHAKIMNRFCQFSDGSDGNLKYTNICGNGFYCNDSKAKESESFYLQSSLMLAN